MTKPRPPQRRPEETPKSSARSAHSAASAFSEPTLPPPPPLLPPHAASNATTPTATGERIRALEYVKPTLLMSVLRPSMNGRPDFADMRAAADPCASRSARWHSCRVREVRTRAAFHVTCRGATGAAPSPVTPTWPDVDPATKGAAPEAFRPDRAVLPAPPRQPHVVVADDDPGSCPPGRRRRPARTTRRTRRPPARSPSSKSSEKRIGREHDRVPLSPGARHRVSSRPRIGSGGPSLPDRPRRRRLRRTPPSPSRPTIPTLPRSMSHQRRVRPVGRDDDDLEHPEAASIRPRLVPGRPTWSSTEASDQRSLRML